MPRDANGNYALPAGNPVVSGTTIESSWANQTMDDIRQALQDSLDRYGRGGMQAEFRFINGTYDKPAISFASEIATGLYLAAAHDLRVSVAAKDRMQWTDTAVNVWDPTLASGAGAWTPVITGAALANNSTQNTFTFSGRSAINIASASPNFRMSASGAPTDAKNWIQEIGADGSWYLEAFNDALDAAHEAIKVTRTGIAITGITFGNVSGDAPGFYFRGGGLLNNGGVIQSGAVAGALMGSFDARSGQPGYSLCKTDAAADTKFWLNYLTATQLICSIWNDAGNFQRNWMTVTRSGANVTDMSFGSGDPVNFDFFGVGPVRSSSGYFLTNKYFSFATEVFTIDSDNVATYGLSFYPDSRQSGANSVCLSGHGGITFVTANSERWRIQYDGSLTANGTAHGFRDIGGSYGSLDVLGSNASHSGFRFVAGFDTPQLMFNTTLHAGGFWSPGAGWWLQFNGAFWETANNTRGVPETNWGGGVKRCLMWRATFAPTTEGADGDLWFQYA